jgi:hypothetical protein
MIRTLAIATTALLASASANAAIVSYNFTLFAPDSSIIGTGSFSYDDSILVDGDGTASVISGSLTLSATIFGIAFDATNDSDYSSFPLAIIAGGVPIGIDYILNNGVNGVDFTGVTYGGFPVIFVAAGPVTGIGDDGSLNIDAIVGTREVPVPAPASLALFGLGLAAMGAARRRS